MKIIVIDSSYLIYRSYFAFYKNPLSITKNDVEIITSSIFGFIREILHLQDLFSPDFFITVWDAPPYKKKDRFPSYKENRKNNKFPSFRNEKEIIQSILRSMNIPCLMRKGYEAEEVAKYLFNHLPSHTFLFLTNDEDCFVLLSKNVTLIRSKDTLFTSRDLLYKYGVTPKQFVLFKNLTGCKTDNVKGVRGIGPKKASLLATKYKTLRQLYADLDNIDEKIREKLVLYKKDAIQAKFLTKLEMPDRVDEVVLDEVVDRKAIFEYLEAFTFLQARTAIILTAIEKKQKAMYKKIMKKL